MLASSGASLMDSVLQEWTDCASKGKIYCYCSCAVNIKGEIIELTVLLLLLR